MNSDMDDVTPLPVGQIICIVLIQMCEGINVNLLFPFLAFMVEDLGHGGDELGYYAGALAASFCFAQIWSSVLWGMISDKYGRKPAILLGTLGAGVGMLVFGSAKTYTQAILGRMVGGFLNGNIGVVKCLLTEITDDSNRGKGFSYMSLAWAVGTVIAPLAGGLLCKPVEKYPMIFSGNMLFNYYPYLLPCMLSASINVVTAISCSIVLRETRFAKLKRTISTSNASADPDNEIELTDLHRTNANTSTFTITEDSDEDEVQSDSKPEPADNVADFSLPITEDDVQHDKQHYHTYKSLFFGESKQPAAVDSTSYRRIPTVKSTSNTADKLKSFQSALFEVIQSSTGSLIFREKTANSGATIGANNDDDSSNVDTIIAINNNKTDDDDDDSGRTSNTNLSSASTTSSIASTDDLESHVDLRTKQQRIHDALQNNYDGNNPTAATEKTKTSRHHQHQQRFENGSDPIDFRSTDMLQSSNSNSNLDKIDDDDELCCEQGIWSRISCYSHKAQLEKEATQPPTAIQEQGYDDAEKGIASRKAIFLNKFRRNRIRYTTVRNVDADEFECASSSDNDDDDDVATKTPTTSTDSKDAYSELAIVEKPVLRRKVVLLATTNYGILAMAFILLDETIPLFLKLDAQHSGFSFDSSEIGFLLSASGVTMLVFTLLCLPVIARRSKFWMMEIGALCSIPMVFAWPLLAMLNQYVLNPIFHHSDATMSGGVDESGSNFTPTQSFIVWACLLSICVVKNVVGCLMFTAVMIQINHSVHEEHLGKVNGFGQSLASLARSAGPALGGLLWSLALQYNFVFFNFIAVACLILLILVINRMLPRSLDRKKVEKNGLQFSSASSKAMLSHTH